MKKFIKQEVSRAVARKSRHARVFAYTDDPSIDIYIHCINADVNEKL